MTNAPQHPVRHPISVTAWAHVDTEPTDEQILQATRRSLAKAQADLRVKQLRHPSDTQGPVYLTLVVMLAQEVDCFPECRW